MGQTYSAPTTSGNVAAAPTPVFYPRPPYPAAYQPAPYAAPPASSASYSAPVLLDDGSLFLEAIPSPSIPAAYQPAPYADPPATTTPSHAAPLFLANINISFPDNSNLKITSSLDH